jgi:hypothetical protein
MFLHIVKRGTEARGDVGRISGIFQGLGGKCGFTVCIRKAYLRSRNLAWPHANFKGAVQYEREGLLTCCKLKESWSRASRDTARKSALLNAHFNPRQVRSGRHSIPSALYRLPFFFSFRCEVNGFCFQSEMLDARKTTPKLEMMLMEWDSPV